MSKFKLNLTKIVFVILSLTALSVQSQIIKLQDYENKVSDTIGVFKGVNFMEGGFSGLFPIIGTNGTEFWTCSDRGVNIDCANANPAGCKPTYDKMYAFPNYTPKIHRIRINNGKIEILKTITIKRPNGNGSRGIINPTGLGSTSLELPLFDTVNDCSNYFSKVTNKDTFGIDPEGIVVDKKGNFWLCEEGGACIWKLNKDGVLIKRYTPYANLNGAQQVDVLLDTVFKYRKNNRGFEGISITPNGKIYGIIQSGILYPTQNIGEASRIHRIIEIDPETDNQKMYAYLNEGIIGVSGGNQIRNRDWKIGDMAAVNDSTFYVIEAASRGSSDVKKLYQIKINEATVVHSGLYGTKTLEGLVDSIGMAGFNLNAVKKTLVMDLLANAWPSSYDKAEGLALVNDSTIAICNDNDFGSNAPNGDGIPIASNLTSHLITYRLSGINKINNFRGVVAPEIQIEVDTSIGINTDTIINFNKKTYFGKIPMASNKIIPIKIKNLGTDTLIIDSIKLLDYQFSDFTITSNLTYPIQILTNDSFVFNMKAKPLNSGIRKTLLTVYNNDSDENPYQFVISFNATLPDILVNGNGKKINLGATNTSDTNNTDFKNVSISKYVFHNFQVQNIGTDTLLLSNIFIDGVNASDFKIFYPTTFPRYIMADSSLYINIRFTPSDINNRIAKLNIVNNVVNKSNYNFSLSGIGIGPEINVISNSNNIVDGDRNTFLSNNTDFGTIQNNETIFKTFTIQNTGTDTLIIYNITFSNYFISNFLLGVSPKFPWFIYPNASRNFDITWTSSLNGISNDLIYIFNNDLNEGNYSFSLKATKAPITNSISTVKKFTLHIDASYNNMNINVEAIEPINCDLFLYDLNGKILSKMGPINLITGNNDLNIPIKELSEGIYFINLKTKNESQNIKFMVKPY